MDVKTITRAEYAELGEQGYAGQGPPLNPEADGLWWMYLDPAYGTTLVTGGAVYDEPAFSAKRVP